MEEWAIRLMVTICCIVTYCGAKPEMVTKTTFYPAGRIASPVSYETVVLQVDLYAYTSAQEKVEQQLKTLQEQIPSRNISNALQPHLHRLEEGVQRAETALQYFTGQTKEKRQAWAVGLGAIISVGSAIFSHVEVSQMERKLRTEHRRVGYLDRRVSELARVTKDRLGNFGIRMATDEAIERAGTIIDNLSNEIEATVESYYSLAAHRVHPDLIPPHTLQQITEQVLRSAKKKNAVPAVPVATALMHFPLSWVVRKRGIQIFIHIPLVPRGPDHIRRLYWLHNAIQTVGHKINTISGPENFISVGAHKKTYVAHTAGELALCHQMLDLRLCAHAALHHHLRRHCVAGLFYEDYQAILKHCHEDKINSDVPIINISPKRYLIQTSEASKMYCKGEQSATAKQIRRGEETHVSPGCNLEGDTYHLYTPAQDHVEAHVVEVRKKTPTLKISEDTHSAINSILQAMGNHPLSLPSLAEKEGHESEDGEEEDDGDFHPVISELIAGGFGILLFISIIIVIGYLYLGRRTQTLCRRATGEARPRDGCCFSGCRRNSVPDGQENPDEQKTDEVNKEVMTKKSQRPHKPINSPPELGDGHQSPHQLGKQLQAKLLVLEDAQR